MTQRMRDLADEIIRLQGELDREIESRRKHFGWSLRDGLVKFEHGITLEHRKLRKGIGRFVAAASPRNTLTAPVIYSLIIPFALIDAWVSLYQAICFRAYRIPRVRRAPYMLFDRRKLSYLNLVERLNCAFCAYCGGVVGYVREVAARTEEYWCPIKHALRVSDPHQRYSEFFEYGDADGYRERLAAFRRQLGEEAQDA